MNEVARMLCSRWRRRSNHLLGKAAPYSNAFKRSCTRTQSNPTTGKKERHDHQPVLRPIPIQPEPSTLARRSLTSLLLLPPERPPSPLSAVGEEPPEPIDDFRVNKAVAAFAAARLGVAIPRRPARTVPPRISSWLPVFSALATRAAW